MMTRAERRHQRLRVIERRLGIIRHVWNSTQNRELDEPGLLAKFNLNCGCRMCHYYKYGKDASKRRRALKSSHSEI